MPYRIDPKKPNVVQVYKGGKWKTAPGGVHKNHEEALAHLRALLKKVMHAY